jgi:hypothetical protein
MTSTLIKTTYTTCGNCCTRIKTTATVCVTCGTVRKVKKS